MYSNCLTSQNEYDENDRNEAWETYIAEIAGKDRSALAGLYEETKVSVYGFALSIMKNPQDAEDVLQETYIQLFRCAQSYQPQGKPMAYLITIARNLCLMKFRRNGKTVVLSEDEWDRCFMEQESITTEDKLVLQAYLKALTSEEQKIVMLFAVTGFKHREIAQMLGLPLSTELSKYNRALKKLKHYFAEGE